MRLLFNNKGMMTLEAAVIIPIIIAVTMLLIWLGIFYYDINVLDETASIAAAVGSQNSYLDNYEVQDIALEKAKDILDDNLVMMGNINIEVNVSYDKVSVKTSGNLNVPSFFNFGGIYKRKGWYMEIEETAPRLKPSTFIRTIRNIEREASK